ncbi:hypothetical protein BACCIP111895_02466 [Neobacillus rhizosphaerae]|uniref:Lipoprotein n=1 Tax=Neobacillus rhizosphaerae TaxID=2880965 RepID=A0ABM9ERP1_9BACI|nr:hypothetical protein [Neobacillus rhizosphaerae]CAH2715282.1 hypothetical protein BACCIP111895_02466 [Neobacillus rhizosphaerae]
MKIHFLYILLLLNFLLAGCGLETKTIPQFYEKDLADVTKIVIVEGSTGAAKKISDHQVIEGFLDEIKDIKFIPDKNQEARDGFRYSITLFQDGEKTFQFGLTHVNDHYYHTKPDIFPIVNELYLNLNNKK